MIEKLQNDITSKGLGELIVYHINCEEEGKALANKIRKALEIKVEIQCIGYVIGCHVEPSRESYVLS